MTKQDLKSLLAAVATAASRKLKINYFPAMLYQAPGTRHYKTAIQCQRRYQLSSSPSPSVCEEETGHFCKDFYYCLSQSWQAVDILYEKKRKKEKKHHPSQQLKRKKLQPLHTSSYQASNSFVGFLFQRTFFSNFCMLSYGGRVSGWWQICISSETKYVLKYKSAIEKRTIR